MVKNQTANAGDAGLIPGLGRSLGEGNGTPLQYSCLENLMHRGVWLATVHRVAESDMTEHTHDTSSLINSKAHFVWFTLARWLVH